MASGCQLLCDGHLTCNGQVNGIMLYDFLLRLAYFLAWMPEWQCVVNPAQVFFTVKRFFPVLRQSQTRQNGATCFLSTDNKGGLSIAIPVYPRVLIVCGESEGSCSISYKMSEADPGITIQ